MQTFYSFANHVSGLSTQAVKTRAHGFHSTAFRSVCNEVPTGPTKFLFSYPSLLSARGGYPHSGSSASVNNRQTPFSFKVNHITVGDQLGSKRIYNFNHISSQYEFGFNPKKINKNTENCADQQVANDLKIVLNNPDAVNGEERDQYVRSSRPSKVASRSKGFIHHLSIPGEGK